MQCPRCGRETSHLIEGQCAQCASERLPILTIDPVLDATECAHCRRVLVGASWKSLPEDRATRFRDILVPQLRPDARVHVRALDVDVRLEDAKNAAITISLDAALEGVPLVRQLQTRLRLKTSVCGDCSREMGGYYEAILQIRGYARADAEDKFSRIEDFIVRRLHNLRELGRPNSFINQVDRTRHGTDYYFGNHELAKILATEIADFYGAEQNESTKLVGRKDGRDMLRWTLLVRLPPYDVGDFLDVDGDLCKLVSFDRKNLVLLHLERQERLRRERHRITSLKVLGLASDQKEALVVSRTPGNVQVMDPVSFQTIDLPERGIDPAKTAIPVFRWEETLYPVLDPGD